MSHRNSNRYIDGKERIIVMENDEGKALTYCPSYPKKRSSVVKVFR